MLLGICLLVMTGCSDLPAGGSASAGGEINLIAGDAPLSNDASLLEVLQHPDPFERARRTAEILQRTPPEKLEDVK